MKLLSLLKYNIKQNYLVFIIICGVMILYLATIINMYDPNGLEELIALANYKMPPEVMAAFGFTIENNASLLHLINSFFYGMLLYFTLIIYVIIVGNRLIAEHVNNGTMAYLLSTPNTRSNVACMQAGFFLITILLQLILLTVSGVITSEISFPGYLDIQAYIILNIGVFLLFGVFSGISFFSSCIFNDTKNSLALGAGLPLAFIIISILANVDESLHFLRNFTVISLLDTDAIIAGNAYIGKFAVMALISSLLYISGIYIFTKKDLSI